MIARPVTGRLAAAALACLTGCAAPARISPTSAGTTAADEETLRAHAPPLEPGMRFEVPEPYVTTLSNGMRLVVFERHTLPVLAATLVVRRGQADLSHGPSVIVPLMLATLTYGTQKHSGPQIYQLLNENLIDLSTYPTDTWVAIRLRAPSSRLDQALGVLHEVALEPSFPAHDVEVARRRAIAGDAAHLDRPWLAAQRNLFVALFGRQHPYAAGLGSIGPALESVSRDEVAAGWRELMDPGDTTLVVAGDVNPLVLRQSVATLFGGWTHDPARPAAASIPPPAPAPAAGRIIAVDRPGAQQVTILYGGRLADGSTEHTAANDLVLELVDQAETRMKSFVPGTGYGATWSAGRDFPASTFWWEKTVDPTRVRPVLQELDGWFRAWRARGPDAGDLSLARARVTRSSPLALETVQNIAERYGDIVGSGRPLDWLRTSRASAAELPWEQIRRALLDPDQVRVVVVGDLAAITGQLLSLGWGPVEVHDADGLLLRTVSR